jgi:FkbM family methyltransferase
VGNRTILLVAGFVLGGIVVALHTTGPARASEPEPSKRTAQKEAKTPAAKGHADRVYAYSPPGIERPGKIFLKGTNRYSQHDEELIIRDFFQDKRGGFFVDIGAADPIKNSTTYYLEKHLGWRGIAVDALAQYGPDWARLRPKSEFVNNAITDRSDETMTFYQHDWSEVSSLSKEYAAQFGGEEKLTPIEVQTVTITDLLDRRGVAKINHLTIDIEGAELQALAGFDIQRFKPDLICIEVYGRGKVGAKAIRDYMERNGYGIVKEYKSNTVANWYFAPIATPGDSN